MQQHFTGDPDVQVRVKITVHASVDNDENREAVEQWMVGSAVLTAGIEDPSIVTMPAWAQGDEQEVADVMMDVFCDSPKGADVMAIPAFRRLERALLTAPPPPFVKTWKVVLFR